MFETYKKLNMHFDEMISIILGLSLIFIVINGFIQFFVLTQKGWEASFKASLVLAGIVTFLFFLVCFYGYSYGKQDSQLGNPKLYLLPLTFFILVSVTSIGFNYGINIFVEHARTGILHKTALFIWSCIYLGIPLGITGLYYAQLYKSQLATSQKVLLPLKLIKNDALPIYIQEMKFINSTTKEETQVNLDVFDIDRWQNQDRDETIYNKLEALNYEFFSERILIPQGTDSFLLSWYSYTDQKFYSDVFPIDLQKFNLSKDYHAIEQQSLIFSALKPPRASSTVMRFKHHGSIDLFTYLHGQRYIVYYYSQINNEPITEAQQQEIRERHRHDSYEEVIKNRTFLNELLENNSQAESKKFNWRISVDWGQKIPGSFRYTYLNYEYLAIEDEAATAFKEQLLPLQIDFYVSDNDQKYTNSLHLSIDGIKLFNILKALPEKEEITFNIKVDDSSNKVELSIVSKSLNILFSDVEPNIVTY